MGIRWGLGAGLGLLAVSLLARADDAASSPTPDGDAAAEISRLIPQLDDAEFSRRQAASQELMEAGKTVFPELEKAALEGSREASGRAIDILRTQFARGDDATKQAAQAALERLAKSNNAGAAQKANDVLNPPKPVEDPFNGRFGVAPVIRGAGLQIQVAGNIGGARRVSTRRDANGKLEIEAEENGKKTKITKQPDGSIEMEITETVNGKESTKKHSAKNYDELKMKDAEAAKIYDQYNAGGIGNIQIQGAFRPGLPGAPNFQRAPNVPAEFRDRLIESLDRQIEQAKGQAGNNPSAQRLVEILQQRKKDLEQQAQAEKKPAEAAPAEKPAEAPAPAPAAPPATDK